MRLLAVSDPYAATQAVLNKQTGGPACSRLPAQRSDTATLDRNNGPSQAIASGAGQKDGYFGDLPRANPART
uniref:Uncharacterized protein n=1 Tax=Thermogemmatispora argillosa TaxID=2045280 RepID=A0A455T403_9CHLR|nr:hypothetical protein KTA_21810 [Thermogemmatispora argillosa]